MLLYALLLLAPLASPSPAPPAPAPDYARLTVKVTAAGVGTVGNGSGTVVAAGAGGVRVLTCRHVVEGATAVTVTAHDGRVHRATVAAVDGRADLALLRLTQAADLPAARLAGDDPLDRGTAVVKSGHPGAGHRVEGRGRVVGHSWAVGDPTNRSAIADTPSVGGDSGGGLFRAADGRLVGVVWGGANGQLYAVHAREVARFLKAAGVGR